jgi:hypothetical protein
MPDSVHSTSAEGFFIVMAAAVVASIVTLPIVDAVLRKLGLVR